MDNKRVLVVEDVPVIRTAVEKMLSKAGYEVKTVDCADAAFKIMEDGYVPDLVLSDISAPESGRDGLDLYQYINKKPGKTRIVIMSGTWDREQLQRADMLGVIYKLYKPFKQRDLFSQIDNCLRSAST